MLNLTVYQLIQKGGNEFIRGDIHRVYVNQDLFNEATGSKVSFNQKTCKFYIDVKTGKGIVTNRKNRVLFK